MPTGIGTAAAVISTGLGIRSAIRGGRDQRAAGDAAAAAADPFASQRERYQGILNTNIENWLSRDPTQWMQNNPFVQYTLDKITGATNRQFSAMRGLKSGGVLTALQDRLLPQIAGFQNQWFQQGQQNSQLLALLAGATTGQPGVAGQAIYGGNMSGVNASNNAWGSIPTQLNQLASGWPRGNNGTPGSVWGADGSDGLGG